MLKIIIIIAALVIFWMIFGKLIMKFLNLGLTVVFRTLAIMVGILIIISGIYTSDSTDYLTLDEMKDDLIEIGVKDKLNDIYKAGDSLTRTDEWKEVEKKVIEKSETIVDDSKKLYNEAEKEFFK